MFSILAIVIGALMAMGGYVKQIGEQDRRIVALEARASDQDKTLRDIQMTTTRTDATLQALRDKSGSLQP